MKVGLISEMWLLLVLAMGRGDPPPVLVSTASTVQFISETVQIVDILRLGGANPDRYPTAHGLIWVWLDPCVPLSGSVIRVSRFIVAFRYPTANRKILTLVCH
jgi:hypothetical protein